MRVFSSVLIAVQLVNNHGELLRLGKSVEQLTKSGNRRGLDRVANPRTS